MKFTDPRDGNEYKTVVLRDGRRWLAENLRFELRHGDQGSYPRLIGSFPADNSPPDDVLATYPEYDCQKYGRLYTWAAAQLAAPPGWHVPTAREWKRLFNLYGGWAPDIHTGSPCSEDMLNLVQEMYMEFGGCIRASSVDNGVRSGQVQGECIPGAYYVYFGDFMGARFWSSSRPTFFSGFDARKFSGIYFLIRPNEVGVPAPGPSPSAHRSYEVLDYAFSVRCVAN